MKEFDAMSDTAIFMGWSRPAAGQIGKAFELDKALNEHCEKWKAEGTISSFTRVWLEPHGGDLNGMLLLTGEVPKLQALKQTDEWNDLVARASLVLDGFGINHAVVNKGVDREIARVRKLL